MTVPADRTALAEWTSLFLDRHLCGVSPRGCPARIITHTVALTPGTRLGVYEITAHIGEGGMGQVYRARDTQLDRNVAIKILPETFAADAERVARFQREAKVLASLNHPNIAIIHGLEHADGAYALAWSSLKARTSPS